MGGDLLPGSAIADCMLAKSLRLLYRCTRMSTLQNVPLSGMQPHLAVSDLGRLIRASFEPACTGPIRRSWVRP